MSRPSYATAWDSWAPFLGDPDGGSETPPQDPHDPHKKIRNWSSLIGIITAIVGNILIALALNVQRYAHIRLHRERVRTRERARAAEQRTKNISSNGIYGTMDRNGSSADPGWGNGNRPDEDGGHDESEPLVPSLRHSESTESEAARQPSTYLKSPYWWLGQVLITLGEMGNFLAYGFAPASIVSPLGVVALVSNCVIAPILFHEKFRHRDFWGVVIAVSGVVTVVLSANQKETRLAPHDVWDAITTLEFEIYLGVTIVLIGLLMWASPKYGRRTILIDLGLVGLYGGYTALSTKGVSSMLSSTLFGAFKTPVTYALLFILIATAVMQVRYVNRSLQRFDSTQVIPIQFVMFTLCVITGSAVLYRDFERTTAEQAVKFVGGCLLTFFGVFLITSGRPQQDEEDGLSDIGGIEETIGLAEQGPLAGIQSPIGSSRSRRSSKSSRVSFPDIMAKPFSIQHDRGVPSLRKPQIASSRASPGADPAPIAANAWQDAGEEVLPPPGTRTLSSDSGVSIPGPGPGAPDGDVTEPSTPSNTGAHPLHALDQQAAARTPHSARPHSRHYAGPLISPSPLSSTVSAVMKDTLRRHGDGSLVHKSSLGRLRSSIRASLFIPDDEEDDEDAQAGPVREPLFGELTDVEEVSGEAEEGEIAPKDAKTRPRSVSDTIGSFFKSKRRRKKGRGTDPGDITGDEDAADHR